jgi:hypothetical protein
MNAQKSIPTMTCSSYEKYLEQEKSSPAKLETIRDHVISYLKWRAMRSKLLILITAATLLSFPKVNFGQAPDLGTASSFTLFTAVGAFSNVGLTTNIGDIGTNVGAFTGYPQGIVNGEIHVEDPVSAQAATDVVAAYDDMGGIPCGMALGPVLGNNQVLTPNVYCVAGAATLSGTLILDGQGDPNALFIFKMSAALSVNASSNIILVDSVSLCNVYWQVNGAFSVATNSVFRGTVIANGAISLADNSSLMGRGLSRVGAITLDNNVVSVGVEPKASITSTNHTADSVTLTATVSNGIGPFSYLWSPGGQTNSSIRVPITVNASYIVDTKAVNGCSSDKDTFVMTVAFLPIELLSFNATCNHQNVVLEWSTATETNNDSYSIEHGPDGINWQAVGTIDGVGNSSTLRNYSLTDQEPYRDVTYYRLKQTNYDRTFKYSATIAVENCGNDLKELTIYPNPANGIYNLSFNGDKEQISSVEIYNALGKKVYTSDSYQSAIDLSGEQGGNYFLHFNLPSTIIIRKLVIEK